VAQVAEIDENALIMLCGKAAGASSTRSPTTATRGG
jgi:hypothetical protein